MLAVGYLEEINKIIFEDVAFSLDKVKSSFCNSLFSWSSAYLGLDLSFAGSISNSFLSVWRVDKFFGLFIFCPFPSLFIGFCLCILHVYSFVLYIGDVYQSIYIYIYIYIYFSWLTETRL